MIRRARSSAGARHGATPFATFFATFFTARLATFFTARVATFALARATLVAAFIAAAGAAALAGCAAGNRALKPDAQLVVDTAVPDARVYVDDVFAGRAAELQGRALLVRSGTRRVEVRADGYFTAYRDVAVPARGRATLRVPLRAAPANESAQ